MPIEGILDGLNFDGIAHVSGSFENVTGVTGAEELAAMQAGGGEILESSSNGVALAEK